MSVGKLSAKWSTLQRMTDVAKLARTKSRLLNVVIVLPAFSGGGAERVMLQVARYLDRGRFRITLIVLDGVGPLTGEIPEDVTVRDLSQPRLRKALPELRRQLREIGPDVVFSTMGYLNMGVLLSTIGILATCRFVVREANMPTSTVDALGSSLVASFGYRCLYRRAHNVLCNSERVRQSLVKAGVQSSRISVVRNPIDIDRLRHMAGHPVRTSDNLKFVTAGRLVHQKGFDRLLDWFSRANTNAELVILGEGAMRDELEAQIIQLGISERVSLSGYVSNPWPLIAEADAFLLPSRWEGMSNAALEALALGVPVIASDEAGGISELLAESPDGAITVATGAEAFIDAMNAVQCPIAPNELGESLLPEAFRLQVVLSDFERAITDNLNARY